ncbi:hypothetical protein ACTHGU_19960 [Chitinophagaceae bacterium MMS25-I14]
MKQYILETMRKLSLQLQTVKGSLSTLFCQWTSEEDHVMTRLEEQFFSEGDIACR